MTDIYRLSFEVVRTTSLYKYSNADPAYYSGTTQIVPNSQIPDEDWHLVTHETENPWDQYRTLKEWAQADKEFVRNIKLERMVTAPSWEEVTNIELPN